MASNKGSGRRGGAMGDRSYNNGTSEWDSSSGYMYNGEMNANLSERFRSARYPNSRNAFTASGNNGLELTLNLEIRDYFVKQEAIKQNPDSEAWLLTPEIPGHEELSVAETAVPKNKIKGPYKSKERYLKTQYSLLREDAVGSLRDAVLDFQSNPTTMDTAKFSIYDQVHIAGFTFARRGLAARIKFSTKRAAKKISWQTTKRLTSGSIVALVRAKDKLTDLSGVVTAIVAARPLNGVLCRPPEIDLYFCRSEDIQIDPQEEWIMIEAKQGYYEAYRHTLRALQKLSQESFPLSDTICGLVPADNLPNYIQQRPILNLSAAAGPEQKSLYASVDVTQNWPEAPMDTLDDSQWEALREMITKPLCIVQGPPGTGKTHVSKIAVQVLRENRQPDDPPIIIAAQTNHALDQLLMHISKFEQNYVRLGGRSTNPEVKRRALFEIRQKERIKQIPGGIFGRTNALLDKQAKALINILGPLTKPGSDLFSTENTSGTQVLVHLGVLNEQQAKSLENGASRIISVYNNEKDPLKLWLDSASRVFDVKYNQDNYGFEEVEDEDLEFEQLRENEDSTGVNDEEDIEMLKGPWAEIGDETTVRACTPYEIAVAEKEFAKTNDLFAVQEHGRGPMYLVMRSRAIAAIAEKVREAAKVYNKLVKDSLIGKWEQDYVYLKRANIIGMTTTGLSKYRALIAALKPQTILIEEAAEVLEAPVAVACIESLQHLILVGDHQQLQGHCSVSELEGPPFNLNVSLFERLVNNSMAFKTLLRQRRMNPQFRRLLSSVYPALTDHPSVVDRTVEPWGMGGVTSFFFDHEWPEFKDASLSTYNEEEAKFIAVFYRHLQKNGITAEQITILTFYNGQRKRLLKELKALTDLTGTYHNVKTVDSYQGEENDIIILSMVRSTENGKIGFLSIDNRVTVALSRARLGFYLFGNAKALSLGSPLWLNVITMMRSAPKRLHNQLPIFCKKHQTTSLFQYPEDFHGTEGGCTKDCGEKLPCGHKCPLKCHPYSHDQVQCRNTCQRSLACGHGCQRNCSDECYCSCKAYADFKRTELENAAKNWTLVDRAAQSGAQDIQGPSQGGQDGQSFPQQGSTPYLRSQFPGLLDSPVVLSSSNNLRMMETIGRRSPLKAAPRYNPSPEESRICSPFTAKHQKESQLGWNKFAKGGVKADDERRALSASPQPPAHLKSSTNMRANVPSSVEKETARELNGRRTRYTHDYRINPGVHGGSGDRTDSAAEGGEIEKEVETKDAMPAPEKKKSSYLDDLAGLDEYYRK